MLKNCKEIWKKVKSSLNIKFDSEPVYGDKVKYIKTKIIMLDSAIKVTEKYYPQTFLEECKYEPKKIKMENLIDDDLDKVNLMSLIVILTMKQNLMMNLTNNLLKAKKVY